MTDREKARDLGNKSAELSRSIADLLNDTLDALARAERDLATVHAVEHREGMMEVYDWKGRYSGCVGVETWAQLVIEAKAGAA